MKTKLFQNSNLLESFWWELKIYQLQKLNFSLQFFKLYSLPLIKTSNSVSRLENPHNSPITNLKCSQIPILTSPIYRLTKVNLNQLQSLSRTNANHRVTKTLKRTHVTFKKTSIKNHNYCYSFHWIFRKTFSNFPLSKKKNISREQLIDKFFTGWFSWRCLTKCHFNLTFNHRTLIPKKKCFVAAAVTGFVILFFVLCLYTSNCDFIAKGRVK